MEKITVVIPVGPNPVYKEYLPECIESVLNQTYPPDEIFVVDDAAGVNVRALFDIFEEPFNWHGTFHSYLGYRGI